MTGTYAEDQQVTLTTDTDGADIYYTTDGSTPSKENGTRYTVKDGSMFGDLDLYMEWGKRISLYC